MPGKSAFLVLLVALGILATSHGAAGQDVFAMDEDIFAAGGELRIAGRPEGDLIAAGGRVDIQAGGALDVIAAGGRLFVDGLVGEDAILAGGTVSVGGEIAEDLILAGGRVRLNRGARIGDDALIAGGEITLEGSVGGDVVIAGGRIVVGGRIGGDLQAAGGRLEILPGAQIAGAVGFRGEDAPVIATGATIGGDVDHIAKSGFGRRWGPHRGLGWGGRLWVAIALIATGIIVILLIPGIATSGAERLRMRPLASALIGLAMMVGIPILAVLLMATVIGIPLGIIVAALYPAALFVGFVVTAFAVSEWALTRHQATPTPLRRFGAFALVVAALCLAYAIPWIGGWLALITLLCGLGALGQVLIAARGSQVVAS